MSNSVEHSDKAEPLRERPVPAICETLQGILGQELVAFSIYERNPKKIGAVAKGDESLSEEQIESLRDLAEVTEHLVAKEGEDVTRAIVIGANPSLNDWSVVELFHEGKSKAVVAAVDSL